MRKTIKRILCLTLAAAMVAFSFASCGSSSDSSKDDSKKSDDKTYTVGICQLVQHEALDAATKGFKEALTKKLGDKVKFDEQNASGEANNCATIVNKFVSDNVDLIMANATPALQAAYNATPSIPIVATSVTDYATALDMDVKDWTGKTGINVTGTADLAPLDQQAAMFKELLPDVKNVGIIYCSAEANSKFQAVEIAKQLKKLGISSKEYSFADTNDVSSVVTKAVSECDALYAPTDNTVASNGKLINDIAEPAGIPLIAGEEGICRLCGVATLSITYYDIGYSAGEMAYDILVNGKDPADMDIQYSEKLQKKYDKARCDKYNIKVPDGYEALAD